MQFILYDNPIIRNNFLPLVFTRPIAELHLGIFTIQEKWEALLGQKTSIYTPYPYLQAKYPYQFCSSTNVLINATILPTPKLINEILELPENAFLVKNNEIIATKITNANPEAINLHFLAAEKSVQINSKSNFLQLFNWYDLFLLNSQALETDFNWIKNNKTSSQISKSNTIIGNSENIFVEEGAILEACTLNANKPIYIGKNAEVMEGCNIRNGLALCESGVLRMGSKAYGATTIGKFSKAGGELSNCIIMNYSNKAHDGFLGNSVIGQWCNLGANTNVSNLKNNYSTVSCYNYNAKQMLNTHLQFCGLCMGDFSKSGINTMFNTGTVIGIFANIWGSGFPDKHIPNFSWLDVEKSNKLYQLEKALETTKIIMNRRNIALTNIDVDIITYLHYNF